MPHDIPLYHLWPGAKGLQYAVSTVIESQKNNLKKIRNNRRDDKFREFKSIFSGYEQKAENYCDKLFRSFMHRTLCLSFE